MGVGVGCKEMSLGGVIHISPVFIIIRVEHLHNKTIKFK